MKRLLSLAGLCLLAAAAAVSPSVAGARTLAAGVPTLRGPSAPAGVKALPSHLTARLDWNPPSHVSLEAAMAQSNAGTTIPMWSRKQGWDGTQYTYTMVGRNPFVAEKYQNTTIPTYLVSLDVAYEYEGNAYQADPSQPEPCDPADKSPTTRVENSPIFKNKAYTWGGTPIATTGIQLTDAFQRAEFWKYTNPTTGVNPSYNIRLSVTPIYLQEAYPDSGTQLQGLPCTQDEGFATDITEFDSWIQNTVFPYLQENDGIGPTDLVVFLVHNVFFYNGTTADCCILGYHSAFGSPVQTYAVADYDTLGDFSDNQPDISPLSHEVAQWMDDPLGTVQSGVQAGDDGTPAWGHVGNVTGCDSYLDVGLPLFGTNYPVLLNGFKYHPQELAFFSWFYHQHPSIAVNGWYSDQGTFTSPAASCS